MTEWWQADVVVPSLFPHTPPLMATNGRPYETLAVLQYKPHKKATNGRPTKYLLYSKRRSMTAFLISAIFQHIICRIWFIYFKHCLFHRTHTCFITIYNILNQITVICLNLIFFKNIKCMRAYNIGINLLPRLLP